MVFAPQNTLQRIMMSPTDFDEIEHRLPFILTTEDLPQYDVTYLGRQHVDDLDTYVFDAGPKRMEKGKHYFKGKVWVDAQDYQIVLVNGTTVPQDTRRGHEDLQPPFTTYYEQVDGEFWFPTYTKAEGNLHFAAQSGALSQDVHIRSTVKYTDYKRFRSTARSSSMGRRCRMRRSQMRRRRSEAAAMRRAQGSFLRSRRTGAFGDCEMRGSLHSRCSVEMTGGAVIVWSR